MNDRQASSGIIKDKNMNGGKTNAACANRKHAAIFPWFRTKIYGICCLLMRGNGMHCRI